MKRTFVSLTPQEGLHVAIFIEERNAQIYEQFSELFAQFEDPESREISTTFWDMAEEERQHGAQLQERYRERYGTHSCPITEEEILEIIELPRLEDGNIFAIARAGISAAPSRQALRVALAAEEAAQRFYRHLLEVTPDAQLRIFYRELAEFENDHTEKLRRRMNATAHAAGQEA